MIKTEWRPEGWEKGREVLVDRSLDNTTSYVEDIEIAYEAGASAMYKALWKLAEESPTKTFTLDTNVVNVYGMVEPLITEE